MPLPARYPAYPLRTRDDPKGHRPGSDVTHFDEQRSPRPSRLDAGDLLLENCSNESLDHKSAARHPPAPRQPAPRLTQSSRKLVGRESRRVVVGAQQRRERGQRPARPSAPCPGLDLAAPCHQLQGRWSVRGAHGAPERSSRIDVVGRIPASTHERAEHAQQVDVVADIEPSRGVRSRRRTGHCHRPGAPPATPVRRQGARCRARSPHRPR